MITIVLPFQSSRAGLGVAGYMLAGADFTPYTDFIGTYDPKPIIPIQIFTAAMVYRGVIDDYEYFRYERNWYEPDNWEIDINRYKVNVDQFAIGGFIRYNREGVEHIGIIERIEKPLDEKGKGGEQWKIIGRGAEAVFSLRICMYGTATSTGYHVQNAAGETALRAFVDKECISAADTNRNITGLTLAAPGTRGTTVDYSARFNILSDVLTDICKAAGLSCGLVWSGSGLNFVFTVYEGADVSASVVISPEFGNVATFQYLNSVLEMKNLLYVGGTGTDASRAVREVYDTTEPTGWARREQFVEASDCADNAALDAKGAEVLATVGEETALEVSYLQSNTFIYGVDFDLGDIITVVFPDVAIVVSRIVTVTEEWDENGERITLGIGKKYPDLVSIMKQAKQAYSAQSRR